MAFLQIAWCILELFEVAFLKEKPLHCWGFACEQLEIRCSPEAAEMPQHGNEESFKLKRTFLLTILAVVPAVLMPLAIIGQVAPDATPGPAGPRVAPVKYEVFVGYGYSSLRQVNQSRYGLQGVNVAFTRDWGKHFGVTAEGDYYKYAIGHGSIKNPGNPMIIEALAGPEFHINIYGNANGFLHALLGVEHTGGEGMTPDLSFAGGIGGGMTYDLSRHWGLRASGNRIGASFSPNNNTPDLAYSPHRTWNSSGTFGVIYKF
jgi:hypothetical protein